MVVPRLFSGEDRLDHVAVDVGEASLDGVVVEGEPRVVEAEQVEDPSRRPAP